MVDVTLNIAQPGESAAVKLQTDTWELNVWAPLADLAELRRVRDAKWLERSSLAIGRSAGAPVWWCSDNDLVTILVGGDSETWDIAVTAPLSVVDEIASLAEQELRRT